jgi:hypothetical protein
MRANRSSLLTRIGSGSLVGILAAGGIMAHRTSMNPASPLFGRNREEPPVPGLDP